MAIFRLLSSIIFLLSGIQTLGNEKLPQEFSAMKSALCDKPSDFTETGCRVCPGFMAKSSEGPLKLNGALEINSILLGSFTSVDNAEALLGSGSCFSHADGFASAFLLRKEQGSWHRLSFFHREGPLGICSKIPGQSDTRDLLICQQEEYGIGAITVIGFDEGTSSKISDSKKIEGMAVFIRNDDIFAADERTEKLLLEVEKSR
jgi:hypothetical protein